MPKLKKRALLLLVVLAMLPASLYGCTGGTEPTPPGASESGSQPSAAQTGELPPNGNSVTVGIAQDLDDLDPQLAKTAGIREVLFNIFEGLVKASPDGSVIPAVASDYELSEDGTTYTFTLREGVTFHNGNPVTAEDVVYSLERCAGSENEGTPLVSAFSNVSSIQAPDGGHVVITLAQPSLEFLNALTAPIIPKDSGPTIAKDLIGTGPFRFVSYAPQDSLVMEKYDGYWNQDKAAKLDKVTFKIIADTNALVIGLKGETLDMVIHLPNTLEAEVKDQFTVHQDTMKLVQALYLNNAVKPFDNELVRQAMYYAIDVEAVIDFVCDGAGVATGTSMYPANEKYFVDDLAQAGYPDGFSMKITVPSNYKQHVDTGLVLAEQLKAVGITAEVEQVEWSAWVSDVYRGRQYEATVSGIAADDMTAREMLVRYMTEDRKNFIAFSDPEYDEVLAKALSSIDGEEQTALYQRAEEILNERAASLWLQDMCDLVVMNPALDGFTFYSTYVLDMSTIGYR